MGILSANIDKYEILAIQDIGPEVFENVSGGANIVRPPDPTEPPDSGGPGVPNPITDPNHKYP